MSTKKLEERDESDIRILVRALGRQGIVVRRERLSRGREFRVKSGKCLAFGSRMLFIDRNLPVAQQVSLLVDCCAEQRFKLLAQDVKNLSDVRRAILAGLIVDKLSAEATNFDADSVMVQSGQIQPDENCEEPILDEAVNG